MLFDLIGPGVRLNMHKAPGALVVVTCAFPDQSAGLLQYIEIEDDLHPSGPARRSVLPYAEKQHPVTVMGRIASITTRSHRLVPHDETAQRWEWVAQSACWDEKRQEPFGERYVYFCLECVDNVWQVLFRSRKAEDWVVLPLDDYDPTSIPGASTSWSKIAAVR